jgi:uncharacterized Zn ribbon protein
MKELPVTPGRRKMCPDNCRYRDKRTSFCGFCMMEIKKKTEEEMHGNRQVKDQNTGKIKGEGLRHSEQN